MTMLKRALRGMMTLVLAFTLVLGISGLAYAAEPTTIDQPYDGYLVKLVPSVADGAQLFSQEDLVGVVPILQEHQLYRAASLSDIQSLVYDGWVVEVEPDYQAELFGEVSPNDPEFASNTDRQYNLKTTNIPSGWECDLDGTGVKLAIIDSGMNINHIDGPKNVAEGRFYHYLEDPKGNISLGNYPGKKFRYVSTNNVIDDKGHGSMVTGVAAAITNNGIGIAGIAPNVTIIPVKAFSNTAGRVAGMVSTLVSALDFAVASGADIINMSWGIRSQSAALKDAIDRARAAGCILVASSGNDGAKNTILPAQYDNVISVGATDRGGNVTKFSQRNTDTDLSAPGVNIYSLSHTSKDGVNRGDGTSFSAPTVAAAIALLVQAKPGITQEEVMALLQKTAKPFATDGGVYNEYGGVGILNLQAALKEVKYQNIHLAVREGEGVTVTGNYQWGEAETGYLMVAAAYNEKGHLLDSKSKLFEKPSATGGMTVKHTFARTDVDSVQIYLLNPGSFLSLVKPQIGKVIQK